MDEAIRWHIRQQDPDFRDWEGFTAWLEADEAHAEAYARLAARDQAISERIARSELAPSLDRRMKDPSSMPVRRRAFFAGAAMFAAAALGLGGAFYFLPGGEEAPGQALYAVTTPPGIQRTIRLDEGSTLELNGQTAIRLDRNNPRYAEVASGEVVFEVVHDDDRPFMVKVAGADLLDMGTRFNVLREKGVTEVAVSEGAVRYESGGQAVELTPGRKLRAVDGNARVRVSNVDPAKVGSWAEGRLVYAGEPLAAVAGDVGRIVGVTVRADPSVAARPVTAVIQLPADREALAPLLEKTLDIKVRRSKDGWVLTESH